MRSSRLVWLPCVVLLLCVAPQAEAEPPVRFEIQSDFGEEGAWTGEYLELAARMLIKLMDAPAVKPPKTVRVELKKDGNTAGIAGYAAPDRLGFSSSSWPQEKYREWILAHELANLFAHHYGGTGGYPSDWWANGRSPFPLYVSCLVMEMTGHKEAAAFHKKNTLHKPDHALYWRLHEKYGYALFARFFQLIRADGIDLGRIGSPWPQPERRRSAYTIAYLSAAAGENLAGLCREHGVGREPDDWSRIHPKIPFVEYEVTSVDVDRILEARAWLFGRATAQGYFGPLREAYRRGGALDTPEGAQAAARIRFDVQSQFGEQSHWVAPFLARMSERVLAALGEKDWEPPNAITVHLRRMENLGGIGGGPQGGDLAYVSNTWPLEKFRLWILTRDLVHLLVRHQGGTSFPTDWWKPDLSAFTDAFAARLLEEDGRAETAQWLRSLGAKNRLNALYHALLQVHGAKLFRTALALLRRDGIDLSKIEPGKAVSPLRSAYTAAYLSLAAGKNLAPVLRGHGVGTVPPHWKEGVPFEEYALTDADVERVMRRRTALFGKEASEAERAGFRAGR